MNTRITARFLSPLIFLGIASSAAAQTSALGSESWNPESWQAEQLVLPESRTTWPHDAVIDGDTYYVGPGDVLGVFTGRSYEVRINPESYFFFPGFEPISVRGLTLNAAKEKIRKELGKRFDEGLVHVSIQNVKTIRVPVLGEVEQPGVLVVPGNVRVAEIIQRAGGFSRTAGIPRVEIVHADDGKTTLNLGDYYGTGNVESNPYPKTGDRIIVPRINRSAPHVEFVAGGENHLYQLVDSVTLGEALPIVAGVIRSKRGAAEDLETTSTGDVHPQTPIDLRRARINGGEVLSDTALLQHPLQGGDVVEFYTEELMVYVEGGVERPLAYVYKPGKSARDYMAEAGISLISKHYGKVTVVRADGTKEKIPIDGTELYPGDHLYVSRNAYTEFKEFMVAMGSVATVLLSIVYLINAI